METNITSGLDTLYCSGSAQPPPNAFQTLVDKIKAETGNKDQLIVDFDLREESHGYINDEIAVTLYLEGSDWANAGKDLLQINTDEIIKLYPLLNTNVALYDGSHSTKSVSVDVKSVQLECDAATKNNVLYIRLPVQDNCIASDEIIDQFVTIVNTLPPTTWYHFHCMAGEGRTTTFMSMFDMMRNSDKVSCTDILERQCLIDYPNGKDLNKCFRSEFLEYFYQYCQDSARDNFQAKWSDWKSSKGISYQTIPSNALSN